MLFYTFLPFAYVFQESNRSWKFLCLKSCLNFQGEKREKIFNYYYCNFLEFS